MSRTICDPKCPFCGDKVDTDYEKLKEVIPDFDYVENGYVYTCQNSLCGKQFKLNLNMIPEFEVETECCAFDRCLENGSYYNEEDDEWRCESHKIDSIEKE